jgi:hypothetical protein
VRRTGYGSSEEGKWNAGDVRKRGVKKSMRLEVNV